MKLPIATFPGLLMLAIVLGSTVALGANRPWAWSLTTVLLFLAAAAAAVLSGGFRRGLSTALASAPVPATLLVMITFWALFQPYISTLLGEHTDPQRAAIYAQRFTGYGIAACAGFALATEKNGARLALYTVSVFTMALALASIYALISGLELLPGLKTQANAGKTTGTFVNQNSYVMYAAFGLFASLALLSGAMRDLVSSWPDNRRKMRLLANNLSATNLILLLSCIANLVAMILTGSRAGTLAALLGLIVLLLLIGFGRGDAKGRSVWILPAIILPVLIVGLAVGYQLLVRFYFGTGHDSLRWALYSQTISALNDIGLLGTGLGSYQDTMLGYRDAYLSWLTWNYAHNSYLELAIELGIPAACLFFFSIAVIIVRIFRQAVRDRFQRTAPLVALACSTAAAFHSLFDFSLQMPATAALYAFILGLGLGSTVPPRKNRSRHA